ncbi:MAG: GxxExxY protein [Bacteroidetes bacterium]|nr:GxxExxY protein [Bacteroidota bacterium]
MVNTYLHSELTGLILKAFYKVYNTLGYGFLEKVYQNSMLFELESMGISCSDELPIKAYYEEKLVGTYCADILVDGLVIVELKAIEKIAPEHEAQLVNYLKATQIEVGLLLNFGPKPQHVRRVLTSEYLRKIKAAETR